MLAGGAAAQDYRVLVFTKTAGYRHDSIPAAIGAVQNMGVSSCFAIEATEDSSQFSAANLSRFRVVVFLLTTGDVLNPAEQDAFEAWFRAGGGWVGVHSASDTERTWPFYGQLLGGAYFVNHPEIQSASIHIEDPNHLSTVGIPAVWVRTDEWYNFSSNPRPIVQVLARLDESTYNGGTMGDHPIAWCHVFQGGRAWYTAGGHTIESYSEPHFLSHIRGGIQWAAANGGCGCYANCDDSTSAPALTANDFACFLNRFTEGDAYANCDGSTGVPTLTSNDFVCFVNAYAAGCS
jgi:cytochrome c